MCVYITVCPDGNFISSKACVDCLGHCKNGAHCNKLTGKCDNGCSNHWNGTFCNDHPFLLYFVLIKSLFNSC